MLSSFAFGLLALPAAIVGNPITPRQAITAVDQDTYNNITYYGEYAAASYCSENIRGAPSSKITCTKGQNCGNVTLSDQNTLLKFADQNTTGVTGFVAIDRTKRLVVLSFRGTQSLANIRTIAMVGLTSAEDICAGCSVHQGFYQSWVQIRDSAIPVIEQALTTNPGFKVVATGHSLGGGIAAIAAVQLRNRGLTVDLASYGASRVGNQIFANSVTAPGRTASRNFRVVHLGDPVPDLPPTNVSFNGIYVHFYPAFQILSQGSTAVSPNDIVVLQAETRPNAPLGSGGSANHNFYINAISACGETSVLDIALQNFSEVRAIVRNIILMFPGLRLTPLGRFLAILVDLNILSVADSQLFLREYGAI